MHLFMSYSKTSITCIMTILLKIKVAMEELLVTFQQSLVYLVSIIVNAFFYSKDCLKKNNEHFCKAKYCIIKKIKMWTPY